MKIAGSVRLLRRRHRALAARLGRLGPVLHGTLIVRTVRRQDPHAPGRTRAYGPYYQWTWKHEGKTVTVNLSASQAGAYRQAIANHREAERLLRQMREISLQILEATTIAVKRRKLKTPLDFGLS
ncbi:MAG: hypothetical protein FJ291_16555 [Planctomycetes bacterium]|nr:hypothetical protein [Planctomycetota bacterium]